MEGSWLSHALPRYSPSSNSLSPESRRRSKPPRWRTPSPMSASMIPAPIVSSVYSPMSPKSPAGSVAADDELVFFQRKQRQLEAHLQLLLDAQADGLLSGLDGTPNDDDGGNSTGSSTPTAVNLSSRPRTTRKSDKVGLREARVGLYATIRKLAQLKDQESKYLTPNIDHFSAVVSQLETWENKRQGLQAKTKQIESGQDNKRADEFHRKANDMQNDINDLEARLAEMKEEQRKLRAQAKEIENTVDARLSSYTSSLALVDENVQNFLQSDSSDRWSAIINITEMKQFWQLPHHTRTIETAKQLFTHERDSLLSKRQINDTEKTALEEGALVWKDTVKEVSAFERRLTKAMSQQRLGKLDGGEDDETKELLNMLEHTTSNLEAKHKLAEMRNWKLLVCAIGAELEAFLKGKQILEAALVPSSPEEEGSGGGGSEVAEGKTEGVTPEGSTPKGEDGGEVIRGLDAHFGGESENGVDGVDTDTEDDGPDPELLISCQDTDTE